MPGLRREERERDRQTDRQREKEVIKKRERNSGKSERVKECMWTNEQCHHMLINKQRIFASILK